MIFTRRLGIELVVFKNCNSSILRIKTVLACRELLSYFLGVYVLYCYEEHHPRPYIGLLLSILDSESTWAYQKEINLCLPTGGCLRFGIG